MEKFVLELLYRKSVWLCHMAVESPAICLTFPKPDWGQIRSEKEYKEYVYKLRNKALFWFGNFRDSEKA